jgi:hypothetical protein
MGSKKIIVTNQSALRAKYAGAGRKRLTAAIEALIAADAGRGLETEVVFLDVEAAMKRFDAAAVDDPLDARQTKKAIDAIAGAARPAYLMILGAPDVVAMQSLRNPTDDEDRDVPSDLPYACDARYSRDVEKFLAPTRVVGRLPGILGDTDASYLVSLIERAARWSAQHPRRYQRPFGVTAEAWKGSTDKSLRKVFGSSAGLERSPQAGPRWKKGLLGRMAHFINLHGAPSSSAFYGDPGFPEAHRSDELVGLVREGTVVVAECCYGADLYAPTEHIGTSICNAYLGEGAYAFVGASTIAYGPADENGAADLICQFFFRYLLEGASTGRALLQARQDYLRTQAPFDPIDLKTVGQFYLLGDPSIHPVKPSPLAKRVTRPWMVAPDPAARAKRRDQLQQKSVKIAAGSASVRSRADSAPSADMEQVLARLCQERGIEPTGKVSSHVVQAAARPELAHGKWAKSAAGGGSTYHLVPGRKPHAVTAPAPGMPAPASLAPRRRGRKASGPVPVRIQDRVVLVVREEAGQIVDVYEYMARGARGAR